LGIPLVRACNTVITGAINALGQTIAILGDGKDEDLAAALLVEVPKYSFLTPYNYYGDWLILATSFLALGFLIRKD
jgi:apolipoprotein N-acyltransferase